jgi:hypothetical protein
MLCFEEDVASQLKGYQAVHLFKFRLYFVLALVHVFE